jgi:hypothetical protein
MSWPDAKSFGRRLPALGRFKLDPVERIATHDLTRIIDKIGTTRPLAAHHTYTVAAISFWREIKPQPPSV